MTCLDQKNDGALFPSTGDFVFKEAYSINSRHRYGGTWTDVKLEAVEYYLGCYTKALSVKGFDLWYIDGFAGTGERTVDREVGGLLEGKPVEVVTESLDGSARRALKTSPPFQHFRFIEKDAERCGALVKLKGEFPLVDVEAIEGDVNHVLTRLAQRPPWNRSPTRSRGVVFLDPYALDVEWKTLCALAKTQLLDVWYLFPLRDVTRQLAHDIGGIGPTVAKLDRVLGPEWRDLYKFEPAVPLFDVGPPGAKRQAKKKTDIEAWFKRRLESQFAFVSEPLPILGARAVHTFSLFLAVSNPSKAACDLARQFVKYVNKHFGPGASGRR